MEAAVYQNTLSAVLLQYKDDPFVLGLHDDGHINNTDEGGTTSHQKRSYRKPQCQSSTCSRGEDANVQSVRTLGDPNTMTDVRPSRLVSWRA